MRCDFQIANLNCIRCGTRRPRFGFGFLTIHGFLFLGCRCLSSCQGQRVADRGTAGLSVRFLPLYVQ